MSERAKITAKTPEVMKENSVSQIKKTNFSQSINSPVDHILFLQKTVGNQAVEKLLKSGVIQAKLTIGQPRNKIKGTQPFSPSFYLLQENAVAS